MLPLIMVKEYFLILLFEITRFISLVSTRVSTNCLWVGSGQAMVGIDVSFGDRDVKAHE
jgi:TctA family transporter